MDSFFMYLWFLMACFTLVMSLVRIFRGPTIAEGTLGFDVMSSACIAFFVLFAREFNASWALDGILILTFLSFLGTLAVAYYMEDQKKP